MLIRKKKTTKTKADTPKPAHDPQIGSGWVPGSDLRWQAPDTARPRFEKGTDGVTRPALKD